MAIEKMSMVNIVGAIEDVDKVAREVILAGDLDVVSALNEINKNHFNLDVTEKNVESLADIAKVHPISHEIQYKKTLEKMNEIEKSYEESFDINPKYIEGDYSLEDLSNELDKLYEQFYPIFQEKDRIEQEIKSLDKSLNNFSYIEDLDIEMEKLDNMEHFNYYFGILSKENMAKLKRNYENIPAIVLHTNTIKQGELYLVLFPNDLEKETDRILRSLSFKAIDISEGFKGQPKDIIKELTDKKKEKTRALLEVEDRLEKFKGDNREIIEKNHSIFKLQDRVNSLKKLMVATKHFFYLSAWIPIDSKQNFEKRLNKFDYLAIHYEEEGEVEASFDPPTKLRNNWILSPFEYLIEMYGIPSYGELDPTSFLAITYMLFFGAMFGDVGQGIVIMLGGLYLTRVKGGRFGKLLTRVGISSIVFGFLYGSIFGFEEIIPSLLIRPFENINTVLIAAVVIGIFFIYVSYIYNIINGIRLHEYKDALFGKNGIAGGLFYALILYLIAQNVLDIIRIPLGLGIAVLVILMGIIVIREPLTNIIFNKRPLYGEPISSYYIESFFEIIETLLSMISNTLSFIRIGAFALTHVGLFMAFKVISDILGNMIGSIIVLIIGNIVIIALEGLIVGIQALRLEYYELFSKYYRGEGHMYNPFKIKEKIE